MNEKTKDVKATEQAIQSIKDKMFELFPNALPNKKENACATCKFGNPEILGSRGMIYCSFHNRYSWNEERVHMRLCGQTDFIPENILEIQESADKTVKNDELLENLKDK